MSSVWYNVTKDLFNFKMNDVKVFVIWHIIPLWCNANAASFLVYDTVFLFDVMLMQQIFCLVVIHVGVQIELVDNLECPVAKIEKVVSNESVKEDEESKGLGLPLLPLMSLSFLPCHHFYAINYQCMYCNMMRSCSLFYPDVSSVRLFWLTIRVKSP